MTHGAPVGDSLDSNLRDIATLVWRKTRRVARASYGTLGESVNERECRHYSELSAFLGFIDCGGDPESYATFDWSGQRAKLIKRAHHHMLQLLRRTDQSYDRDKVLTRRRTSFAQNDQYRWSIWKQPLLLSSDENHGDHREVLEYIPKLAQQEEELLEATLMELGKVLSDSLSKSDWALLEQHYFRGRPQRELAKQLGIKENVFNVRMHRARERARKALEEHSPEWKDIFKDL